jgi:hypothetical protein
VALVTCPDCGHEVSDTAPACPQCGRPSGLPGRDQPVPLPVIPPKQLGDDPLVRMILPVGRSGWAIAAGYLGLFALAVYPAPLALICGVIAIVDIKRHPNRHGMGRAIFGIVMGVIGTVVLILLSVHVPRI